MKPPLWSAAHGSIDWLCWPHFASSACFAATAGNPRRRPLVHRSKRRGRISRRYLDHTLVLETRFETDKGTAVLVDFMPPRGHNPDVIRIVRGVSGSVDMEMELVLRFDYGRSVPWVTGMHDGTLRAIAGPDMTVLRTSVELRGENMRTCAEFTVREGESVPFVLTYGPSYQGVPHAGRAGAVAAVHPEVLAGVVNPFQAARSIRAGARTVLDHLEGFDLSAYGRHCRRAYDVTAGMLRRRTQLGLSLLLASRCDLYFAGADECRLLRGGQGLARLVAARRRRQP